MIGNYKERKKMLMPYGNLWIEINAYLNERIEWMFVCMLVISNKSYLMFCFVDDMQFCQNYQQHTLLSCARAFLPIQRNDGFFLSCFLFCEWLLKDWLCNCCTIWFGSYCSYVARIFWLVEFLSIWFICCLYNDF